MFRILHRNIYSTSFCLWNYLIYKQYSRSCGSVVTTANELWAGKIPAVSWELPLLKNIKTGSASNQIIFQCLPAIYCRVKRPETKVERSHSSSARLGLIVYMSWSTPPYVLSQCRQRILCNLRALFHYKLLFYNNLLLLFYNNYLLFYSN